MANEGIKLTIHSHLDPNGKALANLSNRRSPTTLSEIKGVGGGTFFISREDQRIKWVLNLLDARNICRVWIDNRVVGAYLLGERELTLVSAGEKQELGYQVSGSGLMQWLDDATLYPHGGLKKYSQAKREFNFSSEEGDWYDPSQWGPIHERWPDPNFYGAHPEGWPEDAKLARWIWSEPYQPLASFEWAYFRYTFNATEDGKYVIYSAADDHFILYVNGEQRTEPPKDESTSQRFEATRTEINLPAGNHIIAYAARSTNSPATRGPAALILAITRVDDTGNEKTVAISQVDSSWKCLTHRPYPPGWTAGEVVNTIINEARDRGVRFPHHIIRTFTSTLDSYGNPWEQKLNWSFDVGKSLLDIAKQLQELSVDMWIDPHDMTLNMVPVRGVDRSVIRYEADGVSVASTPINLRIGKHLTQAKTKSLGKMKNNLMLKTDEGWSESTHSNSESKYGRLESSLDSPDILTGKALAKLVFEQRAMEEEGATYEFEPREYVPFVDFNVGDWVLAPNERGVPVKRRVMSISVSERENGRPAYHIEFDTIFQDNEQRLAELVSKLSGGGVGGGMANTISSTFGQPEVPPQPPLPPNKKPMAPTNVQITSVGQWSATGLIPQSVATISWDPVVTNTDGTETSPAAYDVQSKLAGSDDGWVSQGTTAGLTMDIGGLEAGSQWSFQVIALSENLVKSEPSQTVTHTMVGPTTKMDKPTPPQLTSQASLLVIEWDGNLATEPPSPPPLWFRMTLAQVRPTGSSNWTQMGTALARGGGSITIPGLVVGQSYDVRLFAVDGLGINSAVSEIASITISGIDLSELDESISDAIDAAKEAANQARNQTNIVGDPSFELNTNEYWTYGVHTSNVAGEARTGDRLLSIQAGTSTEVALRYNRAIATDEGDTFYLRAFVKAANTVIEDGLALAVVYGANESSMTTMALIAPSGTLVPGGPWSTMSGSFTAPPGTRAFQPLIVSLDTTGTSIYQVDDYRVLKMVTGVDVVAGTITGDHIQAETIGARNIQADSIGVGHLQANSVTGRHVQFDTLEGHHIKASTISGDNLKAGTLEVNHVSPAFGDDLNIQGNGIITLISGKIDGVSEDLDNTNTNLEIMQTYYQFGNTGAIISSPGSVFATAVRNDRIEMLENSNVVSYWNSGTLYVNQFVGEIVTIGNHQIAKYLTGTVVRAL